jgi:hypothetical protein
VKITLNEGRKIQKKKNLDKMIIKSVELEKLKNPHTSKFLVSIQKCVSVRSTILEAMHIEALLNFNAYNQYILFG